MPTAAAGLLETDGLGFVPPHDVKRDAASAATQCPTADKEFYLTLSDFTHTAEWEFALAQ
jgi:hypothetical protein